MAGDSLNFGPTFVKLLSIQFDGTQFIKLILFLVQKVKTNLWKIILNFPKWDEKDGGRKKRMGKVGAHA